MSRRTVALFLTPLLALVGCTAGKDAPAQSSPFADCATLTAPPTADPTAGAPSPAPGGTPSSAPAGARRPLPELSFACFTGGAEVPLRTVRGPAVLNLWASWCEPCRKELPAFQRLSERAGGQLHVIGVNTYDRRSAAASVGEDFGVTFPTLVDTDQKLQRALAPNVLPITIFVDAEGRVRHQDTSGELDDAALAELVRRHLGLQVAAP